MIAKSTEGFTLAFFFDWIIILLTVLGPFVLPILARFGKIIRVIAGLTLISLGVFLGNHPIAAAAPVVDTYQLI